ncbi:MAG TPA: hypothetical protein VN635_13295 [Conexibacter sp.]|nr:hypothetical protein [Conexibacter sp.]
MSALAREAIDAFLAAAPQPQRAGMRMLIALERRPLGRRALGRAHTLEQLANGLLAMGHYDEPAHAVALGWDADAVAARGRELRRTEGRP